MSSTEATNRGKDFEGIIKEAFLSVKETVVERLPDPTNGYLGVRNKSDFLMYHFPYMYYIECKSVQSHRLPVTNVTFNQRTGMLEEVKKFGVVAGIICWFIPEDKTYFIPIQEFERLRLAGEKSINLRKGHAENCIEIYGRKKRVYFDYDIVGFLTQMQEMRFGERG